MPKLIVSVLLIFIIISSYCWSQESYNQKIAICLFDLDTPPGADLSYAVKGIRTVITNQLSQFTNFVIRSGESETGEYFKNPDEILKADKVQLLKIRRETGFDGLIFGDIQGEESGLLLTLHLIDFSSGRIYLSEQIKDNFGSTLLSSVEKKIALFADSLIHYYTCYLNITSEPSDAEVWIGDKKVGNTPVNDLQVKDGEMLIQIKKQGYTTYETKIELRSGQKGVIQALLDRNSITVTSQPPEAYVSLNGLTIGTTPIKDFAVDQPSLAIEFTKKGFSPYRESISLKPGEKALIHAELYDLLTEHFRNKKSAWTIDAHNLSFAPTFNIQSMNKIEVEAFPMANFRYYAKFGKFSLGMGAGSGTINAIQHFDTFLGTGEGHIDSTIDTYNGTVLGQCNILDKPGLLEFYLGAYTGFSVSTSTIVPIYYYYPYYESTTNEIQKVNPIIGGEAGFNIYLMKMIKISMLMGSYYAGEMEYSAKKYTYWGEAKYEREKLKLHPFYIGFAVTISLWPALM